MNRQEAIARRLYALRCYENSTSPNWDKLPTNPSKNHYRCLALKYIQLESKFGDYDEEKEEQKEANAMNYEPGQRAYKGFNENYRGYNEYNWEEENPKVKQLWASAEAEVLKSNEISPENERVVVNKDHLAFRLYEVFESNNGLPWESQVEQVRAYWLSQAENLIERLNRPIRYQHQYTKEELEFGRIAYIAFYTSKNQTGLMEWDNLSDREVTAWIAVAKAVVTNLDFCISSPDLEEALKDNKMYGEAFDRLKSALPSEFLQASSKQLVTDAAIEYIDKLLDLLSRITGIPIYAAWGNEVKTIAGIEFANNREKRDNTCHCGHDRSTHASYGCENCKCGMFMSSSLPAYEYCQCGHVKDAHATKNRPVFCRACSCMEFKPVTLYLNKSSDAEEDNTCPNCMPGDCERGQVWGSCKYRISSSDPTLCVHANEVPHVCPCPSNCYCKSNTCKSNCLNCGHSSRSHIKNGECCDCSCKDFK